MFLNMNDKNQKFIPDDPSPLRGDELVSDLSQMSENLKVQNESAFSSPLSTTNHNKELKDVPFLHEEFNMAANLKSSSAPGSDGVSALLIKNTIRVLSVPLNYSIANSNI